ncbi:nucleotidyl transferase [Rhodovarius crocodyli]|uniref:Nucleotidyl transferase n=1 Tax=Rhodovarius crocodyli TaxID=1979269 RepID=A0A437MJX2_9PROT|nr:nucleotidyl transferase [Rhodovarius crocodyli]
MPPLAILAGGLATRLRPITETIPKVLVPVAGEPFLAHQLRLAAHQGFRRVVLCLGHLSEQVEEFLAARGGEFPLDIAISHEGAKRRGTGGALRHALPLLGPEFFVLYGDSYLPIEAAPVWAAFRAAGCPAMLTVLHNQDRWDPSNIEFRDGMALRHDKAARGQPGVEWIDFGLSVFTAPVIADWPRPDPWDLSALTGSLATAGRLAGHEVRQRFYEIGKPEGLRDTESFLSRKTLS